MILFRALIPAFIVAGILGLIVSFIIKEADHRARMRRSNQYQAWVKTLSSMSAEDRQVAHIHILRVLQEGPHGAYRGPWEEYELPKA